MIDCPGLKRVGLLSILIAVVNAFSMPARAADPKVGEQVFKVCLACHAIGPNAKNKIGPELNGVVGRKWGAAPGFNYSADIVAGSEGGKIWDEAALNDYLESPKRLVPHGKMAFVGVKDETKRADLIAYLKQFAAGGTKK